MEVKSLLMAMAALTIAGCSQNEVTEMNPDTNRTIGLDVYTGVQTRGAETTTSTLKGTGTGFGIFAYQTSSEGWSKEKENKTPEFMYNAHATWTGESSSGSWGYTPLRFWPADNKITFFAYAPYESKLEDGTDLKIILSGQSDKGAPTITFEVNTEWKDMVDLVTDCRDDIQDQTSETNKSKEGTVQFKFSHVLTKIANIKVKPDTDLGTETKIFVTGLKLDPGSTTLYNKAVYKFDDNTWEATTPDASYFSTEQDLSEFLDRKTADSWGYTEKSINVSEKDDAKVAALFPKDQALYFIPVDNTTGTDKEGDLKLKISYDVVTRVTGTTNLKSTVTDKEVSLPKGTFQKGTAHTYTLTIKMNAIKIEVDDDMEAWIPGSDEGIDVEK
ncbi:fimbrillin family protein [Bacteroides fragilis]|uniref:fimbrillin family protein n=1 Tax=Bacteroides fragilis TaxID=817 RepID=UPI00202EC2BB|nr:fimbrillin family protein [Bacteroides fragilis]MCM0340535.1 fimbrillin family protein [Bacteroides fragilis]